jgi:hypothetical protein
MSVHKMKICCKVLFLSGLAGLGLLMSSCLQVESTISVKKDGSGTITEELVFGEQMVQMMQMGAAQGGPGAAGKDPMAQMLDKTKAQARAKKMGEGVELVSVEKLDAKGKMGIKTIYKFSDINKLTYSGASAMDLGDMPGDKAEEAEDAGTSFKLADGTLTIIQKKPDTEKGKGKEEKPELPDEMEDQAMAMMQGMMKDMRMSMKIKIESGIAKTNATYVDGNTVTLADIDFGKLVANPEKLKALQTGDFDKAKNALKGIDGVKFEAQEKIEIKMK